MSDSAPPPPDGVALGVAELRRRALRRLFTRMQVVKWVLGPVMIGLVAWVLWSDPAPWRCSVFAASVLIAVGIGFHARPNAVRFCERDFRAHEAVTFGLPYSLMVLGTGGLASPVLPIMFAGAYNSALLGTRRAARTVAAFYVVSLWLMFAIHVVGGVPLVPPMFLDPEGWPPGPYALGTTAAMMSVALVSANLMARRTREAVDEQLEQAVRARDVALGNYRERADELTTLSAEIAHELKNPLATVKGLAALISREAGALGSEGKAGERLLVLRREVDRMQGILDEFLNFSRPLAPLTVRRVDLAKLTAEVVELHEGIASDRSVDIRLDAETPSLVTCDPRKIKQILVNLLQNALDAAPGGTRVDVVLRRVVDSVEIQILDRGSGVAPELSERVFEAGMTTKSHGNGLGLPMARALARQHGGDLRLEDRVDGPGCAAIVRMPVGGPRLAVPPADAYTTADDLESRDPPERVAGARA